MEGSVGPDLGRIPCWGVMEDLAVHTRTLDLLGHTRLRVLTLLAPAVAVVRRVVLVS